jgi:hypothetical protein
MSVEYVSTMSLEYCVSYVPERFSHQGNNVMALNEKQT